jgi:hypothetical protein
MINTYRNSQMNTYDPAKCKHAAYNVHSSRLEEPKSPLSEQQLKLRTTARINRNQVNS